MAITVTLPILWFRRKPESSSTRVLSGRTFGRTTKPERGHFAPVRAPRAGASRQYHQRRLVAAWCNPFRVEDVWRFSQGSSFLATLG